MNAEEAKRPKMGFLCRAGEQGIEVFGLQERSNTVRKMGRTINRQWLFRGIKAPKAASFRGIAPLVPAKHFGGLPP